MATVPRRARLVTVAVRDPAGHHRLGTRPASPNRTVDGHRQCNEQESAPTREPAISDRRCRLPGEHVTLLKSSGRAQALSPGAGFLGGIGGAGRAGGAGRSPTRRRKDGQAHESVTQTDFLIENSTTGGFTCFPAQPACSAAGLEQADRLHPNDGFTEKLPTAVVRHGSAICQPRTEALRAIPSGSANGVGGGRSQSGGGPLMRCRRTIRHAASGRIWRRDPLGVARSPQRLIGGQLLA